jgi:hypothetical protein
VIEQQMLNGLMLASAYALIAIDRERIRGCLETMSAHPGTTGLIRSNADGYAVLQPTVPQAQGGKWFPLK